MEIPCVLVRGGTSKGVYIREDDLPADIGERDKVISMLFGSPDARQINGLGGGDPLTSKVAILAPSTRKDCDVTYLSGEVRLGSSEINYGIMCGNLASGVGLAAHHLNLLDSSKHESIIRIFNTNTSSVIHADYVDFAGGISGKTTEVDLVFFSSSGSITSKTLPCDQPVGHIQIDGVNIEYSVVEAGAIYTFIRADSFALTGLESPEELNCNIQLRASVEEIRKHVCDEINQVNSNLSIHPGQVKVALISEPESKEEQTLDSDFIDIHARIINPQGAHHAYAVSGAICCCMASAIENTLVNRMTCTTTGSPRLRIGHPEGSLEVSAELETSKLGALEMKSASIKRTARLIMTGKAYAATQ